MKAMFKKTQTAEISLFSQHHWLNNSTFFIDVKFPDEPNENLSLKFDMFSEAKREFHNLVQNIL